MKNMIIGIACMLIAIGALFVPMSNETFETYWMIWFAAIMLLLATSFAFIIKSITSAGTK